MNLIKLIYNKISVHNRYDTQNITTSNDLKVKNTDKFEQIWVAENINNNLVRHEIENDCI